MFISYLPLRYCKEEVKTEAMRDVYRFCQCRIFLKELNDAVRQLRVVDTQRLHFMQRQQNFQQECSMFVFQRQRKPIYNAAHQRHGHWDTPVSCQICRIAK